MRRTDGLIEGAMTTMLVFKRLTAVAVTICALMAGLGAVWAGDGKAVGLADELPAISDPGDGRHRAVPHRPALTRSSPSQASFWSFFLIVIVRFNARSNPTPSRTTHNTMLEVAWTVIPVVILVAIAVPSSGCSSSSSTRRKPTSP